LKMRELIIIAEGYTEEEFIKNSVRPFMNKHGIHSITPIRVTSSPGFKGGLRKGSFQKLKNDALRYLKQNSDVIVSTLIDFYHLPTDFPEYTEAFMRPQIENKILHLETAMGRSINHNRFVPYIQMHEYEALLFAKLDGFKEIPDITPEQIITLKNIIDQHASPEMINDGDKTSPSRRLLNIIPSYRKKLFGSYIPLVNGFDSILESCPRFNAWIQVLIQRMQEK
ncbi:MAG: DUF4276 family protein, partial [Chitinophagales bacterium]